MSEKYMRVMELIDRNKTFNEIKDIMDINDKELLKIFRTILNDGVEIKRIYTNNGDIKCVVNKACRNNFMVEPSKNKNIHFLAISDTHLGNKRDRLDLLDKVYNYATKDDIHLIFHIGDFIDGFNSSNEEKHDTVEEQIKYAIRNYPYDRKINNVILLGNHDYEPLKTKGLNVKYIMEKERSDMMPLGYFAANIEVAGKNVALKHDLLNLGYQLDPANIKLIGHSHTCKIKMGNILQIFVPSLSDIATSKEFYPTGFLDIFLEMKDGDFFGTIIKQLGFLNEEPILVNETSLCLDKKIGSKK